MGVFIRLWIEVQGDLHDMWTVNNVTQGEEYNYTTNEMNYTLKMNFKAVDKDQAIQVYKFTSKAERDEILAAIRKKLLENKNMALLGVDDAEKYTDGEDELPDL